MCSGCGKWGELAAVMLIGAGRPVGTRLVPMLLAIVGLACCPCELTFGQAGVEVGADGGPASRNTTEARRPATSQDLVDIYERTKTARTLEAVTQIIDACRAIASAESRSRVDRDYAKQLLAWALNRRGELYSDMAGRKIEDGLADEAERLDREALEDFTEAVRLSPDSWRARHNLAIALALYRDFDAAIEHLSRAIELNPDYANAYFNRAEILFEVGRFREAESDYSRTIQLDPNDGQAYNGRAHCRFMLEDFDGALEDYRRAATLAPNDVVFRTDLADAYQFLERWEDAATEYRAAVKLDPTYSRAYQHAAWMMATCPLNRVRNPELAIASARRAIELAAAPTAQMYDTLAVAYAAAERMEEALAAARRVLQLVRDTEHEKELRERISEMQQAVVKNQKSSATRPMPSESRPRSSTRRVEVRPAAARRQ